MNHQPPLGDFSLEAGRALFKANHMNLEKRADLFSHQHDLVPFTLVGSRRLDRDIYI
jgi:hypothetical protein